MKEVIKKESVFPPFLLLLNVRETKLTKNRVITCESFDFFQLKKKQRERERGGLGGFFFPFSFSFSLFFFFSSIIYIYI